jgi:hypothetical protein
MFTGVDPGLKKVVAYTTIDGNDMINNPHVSVITDSLNNYHFLSNEEYRKKTGRIEYEIFENSRRTKNIKYAESLAHLSSSESSNSCFSDKLLLSFQAKLKTWNCMRNEKFKTIRLHKKFQMYQKTSKQIAKIAKNICSSAKLKKTIILFGNGSFCCGGKGYACVPKKKLIRDLAVRAPVVLVNEFRTSKLCPFDYKEVIDTVKSSIKNENRIRQCSTVNETFSKCPLCHDRDSIGAVNITQKGINELLNTPLMAFLQQ